MKSQVVAKTLNERIEEFARGDLAFAVDVVKAAFQELGVAPELRVATPELRVASPVVALRAASAKLRLTSPDKSVACAPGGSLMRFAAPVKKKKARAKKW